MSTTAPAHTQQRAFYPILPPFMLKHIARYGDLLEARSAKRTLTVDRQMRAARMEFMAHAHDTEMVAPQPSSARREGLRRTIYVFQPRARRKLPGKRVRTENSAPHEDTAVNEAFDGLGSAYRFFREVFGRYSVDDHDMPLMATVHYSSAYNNAFWNGEQMVFGDGDGQLFNSFTGCLEIIGHELTHGIVQYTAHLQYTLQAGAVHESICDVMGMLLKQWAHGQTAAQSDWLIGADLLTDQVQGVGLRSMRAPGTAFDDPKLGKDPQPGHMDDYKRTTLDSGGVHINSGIPNRAFYLAATGFGGFAWEQAGKIWYHTLQDKNLRPHYGFKRFARLTLQNAVALYGADSDAVKIVHEAWSQVGVLVESW